MPQMLRHGRKHLVVLLSLAVLAGCASRTRGPAPIEDRSTGARNGEAAVVASESLRLPSGAENAGKPGYYTVRPGDTLIRIALDTGHNWRDVARWNNIDNPDLLEVGQVLRIVAPVAPVVASAPEGVVVRPIAPSPLAAAPVGPKPGTPAGAPGQPRVAAGGAAPAGTGSAPGTPSPAATPNATPAPAPASATAAPAERAPAGQDEIAWSWPAPGNTTVLAGFDEPRNKGLDIAGKAGDPVLASADGRVVYAGAGLRGYGNLVILKHNNTYLTAYAHNQSLLVKEDQVVRKGQKIAEMGSSDADRVKLHFEIRRQGKPVDPARYLPR